MQPSEIKSQLIRRHFINAREGTNNLLFFFATSAPIDDKQRRLPQSIVSALGLPDSVENFYDYRSLFPGVYDRMFQLCIVSLCCDIEKFFKDLFEQQSFSVGNGFGFYQRFTEVIAKLSEEGIDLTQNSDDNKCLANAFQIRHICVHNLGYADETFIKKTGFSIGVGDAFTVTEAMYKDAYDAYCRLLKTIDSQLAN